MFAAPFPLLRALRYLPLWISHSPPHALHPLSPVSCFLLLSNHVPRDRNHGRLSSDFPCIYVHVHECMCCVCVYTACMSVRAYTCRLSDRKRELARLGTARVTLTSRATSVGRRIGYRGNLPIPPRQRAPITKRILRARGDRTVPGRVRTNTERGERESEQGRGELGGSRVSRAA